MDMRKSVVQVNTPLTVCMLKDGDLNAAKALSGKLSLPLSDTPGDGLNVVFDSNGVSLSGYGLTYKGDFTDMLHRITNGRLHHEMISHIAKTKKENPKAIDATAGMGEDSLILAACGYEVTMFEQNPVIAALLRDALRRAKKHPELCDIVDRMTLIEGNSIELMPKLTFSPDIIYLDPMFPKRQKSGLINKKLQLIQKLEQPCFEGEALLNAAISLNPEKIIIKRPLKGENLAGKTPSYTIKGKAIRYDCLAFPK